jgi:hypothetical protein
VQKLACRLPSVIKGPITFPPDPVLPNSIFYLPIHKFIDLILLLSLFCDYWRWRSKIALEFFIFLHRSE